MKRFRLWLRWLIAGPRELDAFKLDVVEAMAKVGADLYVIDRRLTVIENRTPMAAREAEQKQPAPVVTRNWHEFQSMHENGAPK